MGACPPPPLSPFYNSTTVLIPHSRLARPQGVFLISIQPPHNPVIPTVAHIVRDGVEEDVGTVDGAINTALTFILDRGADGGAGVGVVECDRSTAIGVGVGQGTHEGGRKGDGVFGLGVDFIATCAQAWFSRNG